MSVKQKKDGRWLCRYYVEGKSKDKYFGRGIEAMKLAEKFDQELKTQGKIRPYNLNESRLSGIRFQELAEEYMRVKSKTDLAPSTIRNMEDKLSAIILPALGHLLAAGITHKCLDDYIIKRLETPKTVLTGSKKNPILKRMKNPDGTIKYIKRTTVHRELCDIQAILNWGVSKQYLIANPVMGHKKPKRDDDILQPPQKKEIQSIISESKPHLIRTLILSYFIGLRPGATELFRLTWNDIDFEEKTIFIISSKKNGLPYREVPIHDELYPDLIKWYKEDKNDIEKQIITYRGKPIKSVKKAYLRAKQRAGITRRIRLYDFRHAFVTRLLESGADLKTVSETAGHSRTDTTTKIYQHTSMALKRQEIAKLPGLRSPAKPDNNVIPFDQKKKNTSKARKSRK